MCLYTQYITEAKEVAQSIELVSDYSLMFEDADGSSTAALALNENKRNTVIEKIKKAAAVLIKAITELATKIKLKFQEMFLAITNKELFNEYKELVEAFPQMKDAKISIVDFKKHQMEVIKKAIVAEKLADKCDSSTATDADKDRMAEAQKALESEIEKEPEDKVTTIMEAMKYLNDAASSSFDLINRVIGQAKSIDMTVKSASSMIKNSPNVGENVEAFAYATTYRRTLASAYQKESKVASTGAGKAMQQIRRNFRDIRLFIKSGGKDDAAKSAIMAMGIKSPVLRAGAILTSKTVGKVQTLMGNDAGYSKLAYADLLKNKDARDAAANSLMTKANVERIARQGQKSSEKSAKQLAGTVNTAKDVIDNTSEAINRIKGLIKK